MDNKKFGNYIQTLRKEKELTQSQLAEKLNVTNKAVSKWECGKGFPDISLIEKLAEVLEVNIIEIMKSEHSEQIEITEENIKGVMYESSQLSQERSKRFNMKHNIILLILSLVYFLITILYLKAFYFVQLKKGYHVYPIELKGYIIIIYPVISLWLSCIVSDCKDKIKYTVSLGVIVIFNAVIFFTKQMELSRRLMLGIAFIIIIASITGFIFEYLFKNFIKNN